VILRIEEGLYNNAFQLLVNGFGSNKDGEGLAGIGAGIEGEAGPVLGIEDVGTGGLADNRAPSNIPEFKVPGKKGDERAFGNVSEVEGGAAEVHEDVVFH